MYVCMYVCEVNPLATGGALSGPLVSQARTCRCKLEKRVLVLIVVPTSRKDVIGRRCEATSSTEKRTSVAGDEPE